MIWGEWIGGVGGGMGWVLARVRVRVRAHRRKDGVCLALRGGGNFVGVGLLRLVLRLM
jgi:Na+-transporting NADH:ubiquinone oxidoreductase subunit NqrE